MIIGLFLIVIGIILYVQYVILMLFTNVLCLSSLLPLTIDTQGDIDFLSHTDPRFVLPILAGSIILLFTARIWSRDTGWSKPMLKCFLLCTLNGIISGLFQYLLTPNYEGFFLWPVTILLLFIAILVDIISILWIAISIIRKIIRSIF